MEKKKDVFQTKSEVPTDMAEDDVRKQFKKEVETELNSLIETYLDPSDYSEFEEFMKAFADDKVDMDTFIYDDVIELLMKKHKLVND